MLFTVFLILGCGQKSEGEIYSDKNIGTQSSYSIDATEPYTPKMNLKHRLLFVNPRRCNNYDIPFPEEIFRIGFLMEVCSWEAMVNNADQWKYDFDVMVIASSRLSPYQSITPTDIKTAVHKFTDAGVRVIWFHDPTNIIFDKFGLTGNIDTYISVADIFNNLARSYRNFSVSTASLKHGTNYPFDSEIMKPAIVIDHTYTNHYTSTDPDIIFPIEATNGSQTANVVAYMPNKFFVVACGGLSKKSGAWNYIWGDKMILSLCGINNNIHLALDRVYGKKVASFGVDGDSTSEIDGIKKLLDTIAAPGRSLEMGLVSSKVTDELAKCYRELKSGYGDLRLVSHTGNHYTGARRTVTDEIHTISSSQLISLEQPFRPIITSIKTADDTTTFTKSGGDVDTGTPSAGQYCVYPSSYSTLKNTLHNGIIKFNATDVDKQIKISYTCDDEYSEVLGSLKTLREKSCDVKDAIYLTAGSNSVGTASFQYADENGIVLCDYLTWPNYYRMNLLVDRQLKKYPMPMGHMMGSCDDIGMMMSYTTDKCKNTVFPNGIHRAIEYEYPLLFFIHDKLLSQTDIGSIWNRNDLNPDWKKVDYPTTLANAQEFYTAIFTQLDAQNPHWMPRSEYVRRWNYLSKDLFYDTQDNGLSATITVQNRGPEKIEGLTFRIPATTSPQKVSLSKNLILPFTFDSNTITTWFDLPAGASTTVEVRY